MKKKFLSILAAFAVLVSFSACQAGDTGQAPPLIDSVTTVVEETAEPIEMKTVEPPEDGWTLEELNEVLYMNGQPIDLPLMFSALGDGYEIQDIHNYGNDKTYSGSLYYNNQFIAVIGYYEVEYDLEITSIRFMPNYYNRKQNKENYIKINNFGLCNNTVNISDYLGNDFIKSSGFIIYVIGEDEYTIAFTDTDTEYQIVIFEGVKEYD